jgi:predicted TIM-barrel fold metal-dependent hydrolase
MSSLIDVHTHLHPPKLFRAIRRWFAEHSDWDISGQPTEPHDVAARYRAAGVERFVFCSYAHKPNMARELNAWLCQTSRDLDGYGLPLATVHLDDASYLDDLQSALDDGCIGLKIHEDVQRLAVDDPRFDPVYAELARRGGFVLAHIGPIPWDYPRHAGRQRVEAVLAKHPGLNFVVAHFGAPDSADYLALMARHPRLYLDTTMYFASESPIGSRFVADASAMEPRANRIVYGTDYPNIPFAYDRELRGLEARGLPAPALRAILHDNGAALIEEALAGARA